MLSRNLILRSWVVRSPLCTQGSIPNDPKHPSSIHPSIHPSSLHRLSGVGSRGQQPKQGTQTSLSPATSSSSSGGDPEAFPDQPRDIVCPACPGSSQGPALNTSPGRLPGGILIRCPNQFNWLLSVRRSSGIKQAAWGPTLTQSALPWETRICVYCRIWREE